MTDHEAVENGPLVHPRDAWEWFGTAAHLIVGQDCRFHLATVIGSHLVSTVGEWLPDESTREIMAQTRGHVLEGRGDARRADFMNKVGYVEIGSGRLYETMVFPVGTDRCSDPECMCGIPAVSDWGEIESNSYNLCGDATRGHLAMCDRWARRAT